MRVIITGNEEGEYATIPRSNSFNLYPSFISLGEVKSRKKSESQTEKMVKPRAPQITVKCIDTYCELYRNLFVEVRAYEAFKYLHVGIISDIKRKSLPAIAEEVGLKNEQGLLHFLTESPWKAEELEKRRLEIILNILEGREIIVIIDETGDKKKRCDPAPL